jgi:hypothetical protein
MHLPAPNDRDFELPPSGTHKAVCYRVIDLGTQEGSYMGQPKKQHKILVSWELPDEVMSDGRPFYIGQRYTWSMSEKAALRADLESWRGVPFTEKDFGADGFDIKNILGKGCLLTIVQETKNGKTYANIKSISKLMKGMEISAPKNEIVYLWLHPDRWQPEVFHKLSQGIQGTIMKSPEYQAIANGHDDHHAPVSDANELPADSIPF